MYYIVVLDVLARHFMKQILEGMLYLHSYGILHRDLTLANLLLTKDMDVVSSFMYNFSWKLIRSIWYLDRN